MQMTIMFFLTVAYCSEHCVGFEITNRTQVTDTLNSDVVQYLLTAELIRGYLQKQMSVIVEFMVEGRKGINIPLDFTWLMCGFFYHL
jgi:hypothetical protein